MHLATCSKRCRENYVLNQSEGISQLKGYIQMSHIQGVHLRFIHSLVMPSAKISDILQQDDKIRMLG